MTQAYTVANVLGHSVETQEMTMLSQILKLLLLLLFVVNLPSCWSLCDISAARRCAHEGQCKATGPSSFGEVVAKRAGDKAGVVCEAVIETYRVCC